jgi:mannose-6-phosphate isomerase-like protein (cupin superfamily)
MHVKHTPALAGIESEHGEIVREALGQAAGGASAHSLAHITLPPGKAALKHYHPATEESYFILSGQGRMIVDGEARTVVPGDAIAIPPNAVHEIINDSEDLLMFLAVCVPPWTPDCSVFVD